MKLVRLSLFFALFALLSVPAFAQAERDNGLKLFKEGNYKGAEESFKKAVKTTPADYLGWLYLGLSQLKQDEVKNSIKALKTAEQLNGSEPMVHVALGYAYLMQNKLPDARDQAREALKIDPKNVEALYIDGTVDFRNQVYTSAYEKANKAISANPAFSLAYLLKAQALVISFVQQANTVTKPENSRYTLLQEAEESLTKYLSAAPPTEESRFYSDYLESIKFFSAYYNGPDFRPPSSVDAAPDAGLTPLKILSKPRASYTDAARVNGINGIVRLLVGFSVDGKVSHILVIKPLSHGLSEQAVRAARAIKFVPAERNGKPISVVKTVEYHFETY